MNIIIPFIYTYIHHIILHCIVKLIVCVYSFFQHATPSVIVPLPPVHGHRDPSGTTAAAMTSLGVQTLSSPHSTVTAPLAAVAPTPTYTNAQGQCELEK